MPGIPVCPITQQPMNEPVMDPEGNSYEKQAITEWLRQHGTSPITRKSLRADQLVPNRALQGLTGTQLPAQTYEVSQAPVLDQSQVRLHQWTEDSFTGLVVKGFSSQATHPIHIVAVIDISGSMGSLAAVPGEESDGLTVLDIVKHSTLTIVESLTDGDMMSIVSFSDDAIVELEPTLMNKSGKLMAKNALRLLEPTSSTYLGKGINAAIELASKVPKQFFNAIFLQTDGQPSDQIDFSAYTKRCLSQKPLFGAFYTFGFGYSLDTTLLKDIALQGDGTYAFIPDATMVGTIFVNAVSNVRYTYGVKGALTLNQGTKVVGNFRTEILQGKVIVHLPPMRYGQDLTVILSGDVSGSQLSFEALNGQTIQISAEQQEYSELERQYHIYRAKVSQELFVAAAIPNKKVSLPDSQLLSKREDLPALDGLIKDVEGQVTQALSKDEWYQRWGRHYLVSLGFAHLHQICNNFKDPGVQIYGDNHLRKTIEQLTDVFISLPPPKPSGTANQYSSSGASVPVNMSRYYNSGGVCFHPFSKVRLQDGTTINMAHLMAGQQILTADGSYDELECLVITKLKNQLTKFVVMTDNFVVTPYHPIKYNGKWTFPVEIAKVHHMATAFVYNLVMKNRSCILVDNIECVTLAHGIVDDVANHQYFGTEKVVNDLKLCPQYVIEGYVLVDQSQIVRSKTGDVIKINF